MALVGNDLYVANTDAIMRFPYKAGETQITVPGVKVVDLPAGTINHHWTKNIIASRDGAHLYVTVGSNSNVGENGMENEVNRAAILEVDPATGHSRLFASGLRNPNGMDWELQSGALWTAVNERDELGSDLVPDYMTAVQDGALLRVAVQLLRPARRRAGEAGASRSGRSRRSPRLRARHAYRIARACVLSRKSIAAALCRRSVHRPARLVEPEAAEWLQSDIRLVCQWSPR